jgi:hypothetical protein
MSTEGSEIINRGYFFSINKNNSSERKGLFLLSFLGTGTSTIARLSPNGAALTASHVARVSATSSETWRPGLAEQYALQLDKLSAGTASTSIVSMPVYTSRPGASPLSPVFPTFAC